VIQRVCGGVELKLPTMNVDRCSIMSVPELEANNVTSRKVREKKQIIGWTYSPLSLKCQTHV